jgi:signal peptidase I
MIPPSALRLACVLVALGASACAAPRVVPRPAAPPAPPRPELAARAPADARALFHVGHALLVAGAAARAPREAACGVDLARDVGDVDGWVAADGAVHAEIGGAITTTALACLASAHAPGIALERAADGSLAAGPLRARPRPGGGLVLDLRDGPASVASSPGASPSLAARFAAGLAAADDLVLATDLGDPPLTVTARRDGDLADVSLALGPARAVDAARALAAGLGAPGRDPRLPGVSVRADGDLLRVRLAPSPDLASAIRRDLLEAFRVPSASMTPTLLVGDHVLVLKDLAIRPPAPGDVVAFEHDRGATFLKRVVGLPGDHLVVEGGRVTRAGARVPEVDGGEITVDGGPGEAPTRARVAVETLGTHRVRALHAIEPLPGPDRVELDVPAGHVFVLGDHRDSSFDSRAFGPVPLERLRGRAVVVHASIGPRGPRWERFATPVD